MSEEPEHTDLPPTSGADEPWAFCPNCGSPVAGKRFCPGCGLRVGSRVPTPAEPSLLARPAPTPPARPTAPAESPFAPYLDRPGVAFAAEFVLGLLGLLGLGWLYARRWPVGIVLLVGWWALLVAVGVANMLFGSGGTCCFLWLPFHVVVPLISGLMVAGELREVQRRRLMEL